MRWIGLIRKAGSSPLTWIIWFSVCLGLFDEPVEIAEVVLGTHRKLLLVREHDVRRVGIIGTVWLVDNELVLLRIQ